MTPTSHHPGVHPHQGIDQPQGSHVGIIVIIHGERNGNGTVDEEKTDGVMVLLTRIPGLDIGL